MKTCDACGNKYEEMLEVKRDGKTYHFDCFECAIQQLAPRCANCSTRVIGHGLSSGTETFCCAHCARQKGYDQFVDRVQ
jgi:hypothetical protein